jgi:PAS domain S-box-containing protein
MTNNVGIDGKTGKIKVLLIEDNPDHVELIRDTLAETERYRFDLECTDRLSAGLEYIAQAKTDVVLLDLFLPDCTGIDTFISVHSQTPDVPVIVLSALDDEKLAVQAVQSGAQDYLIKGQVDSRLLGRSIYYAIERNRVLGELAAESERLAVTIRSIGEGFISTDTDGRVVLLNEEAEKLTGWSHREAIGKPLHDVFNIVDLKNHERCENPVEKIMKNGRIIDNDRHIALIAKDGTERIVADNGALIRDKDGKIQGVVLVFRDITEKQQIEKNLQRAQRFESIGVLAGGIAHDFNNILTAVLGNVSLAKTSLNPQDEIYNLLTEAEKATMRASDLTQQLLTFSKGGAPILSTTSIAELLKDSISFALRGSKTTCEHKITDNFWPVEIDEGQISQVINNLIINADQAMPEGGIIKLECENISINSDCSLPLEAGKYIKITIKDNGHGIPEDHLDKIFDPYFTTKEKGSGLGLASTYSILKKHKGHISVESVVENGTTFYVYLPASYKKTEKDERKTLITEEIKEKPHPCKGKILVLEDEEIVRDVLVNMLNKIGYEVTAVIDGAEAVELYKKAKDTTASYDVVIMDLTIPGGMGGQEAVGKLLEIDPGAKAIASSGYSEGSVMVDFRKQGFSGFVAKPYNIQELSTLVHELITGIRECSL